MYHLTRTRLATWLLGSLCALASMSCEMCNDPEPERLSPDAVPVGYAQTQCADKWGQAPSPQQLVAAASAYLTAQGITSHQLTARAANQGAACAACTCPTGLVLEGTVAAADLPALLALGFQKR